MIFRRGQRYELYGEKARERVKKDWKSWEKAKIVKEKFGIFKKSIYLCNVKGEANRRQTESNQAHLNCRGAKEEGEAK